MATTPIVAGAVPPPTQVDVVVELLSDGTLLIHQADGAQLAIPLAQREALALALSAAAVRGA